VDLNKNQIIKTKQRMIRELNYRKKHFDIACETLGELSAIAQLAKAAYNKALKEYQLFENTNQ
jgi:hypothetical protein